MYEHIKSSDHWHIVYYPSDTPEHGHFRPLAYVTSARDRDPARRIIALISLTSLTSAAGMLDRHVGKQFHAIAALFRHLDRLPARWRPRAPSTRHAGGDLSEASIYRSHRTASAESASRRAMT